jgi:hypothetical protein
MEQIALMRALRQLLASILIALLILLSGVGRAIANNQNQSNSSSEPLSQNSAPLRPPNAPPQQVVRAQSASQPSQSVAIPWKAIGDGISILSTLVIAIFTWRLWKVSNQQSIAIFDQWIDLEFTCAEKPRIDNRDQLRVCITLLNPTKLPIIFSGDLTFEGKEVRFNDEPLSPYSPISQYFDISIASQRFGVVDCKVTAHFCHLHKITNKVVRACWNGNIKCEWWGQRKIWHATFIRFPNHDDPPST